jgi:hypothetical protein
MGLGDRYNKASLDEVAEVLGTPREGPYSVEFVDAALDELDRRKLIDRNRIGLTGFSRTAYHVLYALIHSRYHIAAAVVADGVNFGYAGCLFYMSETAGSVCENMNGGGTPYGDSLAGWGKAAPTFNLDKIETPVLLQAITAPLGEWEILAGLRWLKKPVDLLNFYPEGDHVLVRPWQRMNSQQAVVDWYSFWLKGEEDPDSAKAEQYVRWKKMRGQKLKTAQRATTN